MYIPGQVAVHAIISDGCRSARGDAGAADEAVRRVREQLEKILDGWAIGSGGIFHVVVTVERPTRPQT